MKLNKTLRGRHLQLWQWLADNPTCTKKDWPGWAVETDDTKAKSVECYACAAKAMSRARKCPIWECNSPQSCLVRSSTYNQWLLLYGWLATDVSGLRAFLLAQRTRLALEIKNAWK